jgi:hypothetical protein
MLNQSDNLFETRDKKVVASLVSILPGCSKVGQAWFQYYLGKPGFNTAWLFKGTLGKF